MFNHRDVQVEREGELKGKGAIVHNQQLRAVVASVIGGCALDKHCSTTPREEPTNKTMNQINDACLQSS